MCSVRSSTSVAPCSASIPRPSSARNRCTSIVGAGLSARPNGFDFSTSPARTDAVSSPYAVRPLARASSQNVGSVFTTSS